MEYIYENKNSKQKYEHIQNEQTQFSIWKILKETHPITTSDVSSTSDGLLVNNFAKHSEEHKFTTPT